MSFKIRLAILLALVSAVAYGAAGDITWPNKNTDGDHIFTVNKAGVTTTVMTLDGPTSSVQLTTPLPVISGGTAGSTQATARTGLGLGSLSTLSTITTSEITNDTIAAVDIAVDAVGESELNNTSGNVPWACAHRRFHSGGGSYVSTTVGSCVASSTRNGVGDHTMVMQNWGSVPICSVSPERNAGDSILCISVSTTSTTNLGINCFISTTGAAIDTTFNVACVGHR